jgi:hypothetical protein
MDTEGWEARMARRAAERRDREALEDARAAREEFQRKAWAEVDWLTRMPQCPFNPEPPWAGDPWTLKQTLGEATDLLNWAESEDGGFACACHGPPNCCINVFDVAKLLRRDAHIVAKQLLTLRNQRADEAATRL